MTLNQNFLGSSMGGKRSLELARWRSDSYFATIQLLDTKLSNGATGNLQPANGTLHILPERNWLMTHMPKKNHRTTNLLNTR